VSNFEKTKRFQIKIFSFQQQNKNIVVLLKQFTLVSKTLSLRKWFLNKTIFVLKNNFSFVSKTLLFRKCFINKNLFVQKTILLSFQKHFRFANGF